MRALAALLLAIGSLALMPAAVAACSPVFPKFADVMATDTAIVIGRVTSTGSNHGAERPEYIVDVERVVRGHVGSTVSVRHWSTFCRDGLVLDGLSAGTRLMIAVEVPVASVVGPIDTLAPYWFVQRGHVYAMVEGTPSARTLDELADHIAALPDTATDSQLTGEAPSAWLAVLLGVIAFVVVLHRPLKRHVATRGL